MQMVPTPGDHDHLPSGFAPCEREMRQIDVDPVARHGIHPRDGAGSGPPPLTERGWLGLIQRRRLPLASQEEREGPASPQPWKQTDPVRPVLQSGFVIFPVNRVGHVGAAWSCAW